MSDLQDNQPLESQPAEEPKVVLPDEAAAQPAVVPAPELIPGGEKVVIIPEVAEQVVAAPKTAKARHLAQEKRDIDGLVHRILVIGLAVSSFLMLAGIVLTLVNGAPLPQSIPPFREVLSSAAAFQPNGLLASGLLVLIATPVVRVIGSIFGFLYERDWRYAGVTLIVLIIVITSLLLGEG